MQENHIMTPQWSSDMVFLYAGTFVAYFMMSKPPIGLFRYVSLERSHACEKKFQ